MNRRVYALLLLALASFHATAQVNDQVNEDSIYLLSGMTANGLGLSFPSTLHRFGLGSGKLLSSTSIAAGGGDEGVDFTAADYEGRVVVLGRPKYAPRDFSVLNMDHPSLVKHLQIAGYAGSTSTFHFFEESPSWGLELTLSMDSRDPKGGEHDYVHQFVSVPLDDGGNSHVVPERTVGGLRLSGFFGTAFDHVAPLYVRTEQGSPLRISFWDVDADLGVPAPQLQAEPGALTLPVKSEFAIVLQALGERVIRQDGIGSSTYHVYSVAGRVWKTLTVEGSNTTVRSFGRWLAFVVAETQPWAVRAEGSCCVVFEATRHKPSPGKAERLLNELRVDRERTATADDAFVASDKWFPGILLLYDLKTEKLYRIGTGQGDSEVVLAEGSEVYYRVNTTLYRGKIGDTTVESIKQVAKDPALGNVHWAFIPRDSLHSITFGPRP